MRKLFIANLIFCIGIIWVMVCLIGGFLSLRALDAEYIGSSITYMSISAVLAIVVMYVYYKIATRNLK